MPPAPKLRHALGNIGIVEVDAEFKAQHSPQASSHVGVTGKVEINLQRIGTGSRPGPQGAGGHRVGGHGVPQHAKLVGQQHFFGQPHHKEANPGIKKGGRLPSGDQLLVDILVPDNGAGDELGEQGDVGGKVNQVMRGRAVIPIDINEIGHRLEGVEGNPDGQRNVHLRQGGQPRNLPQGAYKEAGVLEHPQCRQVQHDAHHQHRPAPALGGLLVHEQPGKEVHQNGADHNEDVNRLSIGVKNQVGQEQEEVPESEGQNVADQQNHRQKQEQER